jgi:hypothetical protein
LPLPVTAASKNDGKTVAGHGPPALQTRVGGGLLRDFQDLPLLPLFGAKFALSKRPYLAFLTTRAKRTSERLLGRTFLVAYQRDLTDKALEAPNRMCDMPRPKEL